ncbi:hypothetical protein ACMYQ1_10415 [Shewanella oncorhynchi]|uniref:hypothetical protein n=1 Tax=Shewanella oncorhynchi TaxID=2726434 RepID=UPI0039F0C4B5
MNNYKHSQLGTSLVVLLTIPMVIVFFFSSGDSTVKITIYCTMSFLILNFFRLKTVINNECITISFGLGLIRKKIKLESIVSVEPLKTSILCGWGIRIMNDGKLYNVSGREAVKIKLKDGTAVAIGTNDVKNLMNSINKNLRVVY